MNITAADIINVQPMQGPIDSRYTIPMSIMTFGVSYRDKNTKVNFERFIKGGELLEKEKHEEKTYNPSDLAHYLSPIIRPNR